MKRMQVKDKIEFAKEFKNIVGCGDVHGKFRELGYMIKERYKITDSVICAAGDIGTGFHKRGYYLDEFSRLNKILLNNNSLLFMVRGNHDDPSYFNGKNKIFDEFSNIALVPDYFTLETLNANILFIGGAISIDRSSRTLNESYWADEPCVYDDVAINNLDKKIDVVITHTAPDYVPPYLKNGIMSWEKYDSMLSSDCLHERYVMNEIYQQLILKDHDIKYWLYGHFHSSETTVYENTMFILCNELEFKELNF